MTTTTLQAAREPSFLSPVVRRCEEVRAMYERSSFNLIVGGILALTVLALLGNIVLLTTTGKAANELWTLASTLTGGLVGLLANPPRNDPPGGAASHPARAKRHITEGDKPE